MPGHVSTPSPRRPDCHRRAADCSAALGVRARRGHPRHRRSMFGGERGRTWRAGSRRSTAGAASLRAIAVLHRRRRGRGSSAARACPNHPRRIHERRAPCRDPERRTRLDHRCRAAARTSFPRLISAPIAATSLARCGDAGWPAHAARVLPATDPQSPRALPSFTGTPSGPGQRRPQASRERCCRFTHRKARHHVPSHFLLHCVNARVRRRVGRRFPVEVPRHQATVCARDAAGGILIRIGTAARSAERTGIPR